MEEKEFYHNKLSHAVGATIILFFIFFKLHHLSTPFYWDESIPYNPAIVAMYHHRPSLAPGAIDPNLYRGHPTLFISSAATWMHIFGASHLAEHSFAIFVSTLLLILVYWSCLRLFGIRAALFAILLLVTDVEFIVQSSFMLPEVMVALFSFASLFFYSTRRYLLSGIALACALYSKESGIVAGLLLGVDAFICIFIPTVSIRKKLAQIGCTGIPLMLISLFYLQQKKLLGWYFFPLHNQLFVANFQQYVDKFRVCVETLFSYAGRHVFLLVIFIISLITCIYTKKVKPALICLPPLLLWAIYTFISGQAASFLDILIIISIAIAIWQALKINMFPSFEQRKLILLCILFLVLYCCFSAANFFTPRYIIAAFVSLVVILAAILNGLTKQLPAFVNCACIIAILGIGLFLYRTDERFGDCDPGAYDGMAAQQAVVDYLEQQRAYDKYIGTGSYLEQQHLVKPATGFLSGTDTFGHVVWEINSNTDYAIFDDIERDDRHPLIVKDSAFKCVFRFERGHVWAEVWKQAR